MKDLRAYKLVPKLIKLHPVLFQALNKPSGRHEKDCSRGRTVPLFAVRGAAGVTWGQLSGVRGLQKGS